MPIELTVPRLGWSMEEGLFGEWLKAAGETIRPGDHLFVLEGEKASQEIEAIDAGILCLPPDAPRPGDTVRVGQVIGFLLAAGEAAPSSVRSAGQASASVSSATKEPSKTPSRAVGPAARRLARQLGIDPYTVATPDPTGRVLSDDVQRAAEARRSVAAATTSGATRVVATPRARRRARELGVAWEQLTGTGRGGRIRERDVLAGHPRPTREQAISSHLAPRDEPRAIDAGLRQAHLAERDGYVAVRREPGAAGRSQPVSRLRQSLAQRMLAGMHEAAPVTLTTKVDAGALVALRTQAKTAAPANVPSYGDMIVRLVAATLPECPALNACWHNDSIYLYDAIHVALAVDTEQGLVAPVLRDVATLSLAEIAERSKALIAAARAGTLSQNELQGGTFTLSSLGTFDIDHFTPILNLPQSAILGVGRIVREPVVRGDQVVPGMTLGLSLTFDHRVIDGAPAARWLQRLSQRIREPGEL